MLHLTMILSFQPWRSLKEGDEQLDWPNSQLIWNLSVLILYQFFAT